MFLSNADLGDVTITVAPRNLRVRAAILWRSHTHQLSQRYPSECLTYIPVSSLQTVLRCGCVPRQCDSLQSRLLCVHGPRGDMREQTATGSQIFAAHLLAVGQRATLLRLQTVIFEILYVDYSDLYLILKVSHRARKKSICAELGGWGRVSSINPEVLTQ